MSDDDHAIYDGSGQCSENPNDGRNLCASENCYLLKPCPAPKEPGTLPPHILLLILSLSLSFLLKPVSNFQLPFLLIKGFCRIPGNAHSHPVDCVRKPQKTGRQAQSNSHSDYAGPTETSLNLAQWGPRKANRPGNIGRNFLSPKTLRQMPQPRKKFEKSEKKCLQKHRPPL